MRWLACLTICFTMAALVGCKSAAKGDKCETKQTPSMAAGKKMEAMMATADSKDLKQMKATAQELCEAMAKHGTRRKMKKNKDYMAKDEATKEAIKEVIDAPSTMDAADAISAIKPTCSDCHMAYSLM